METAWVNGAVSFSTPHFSDYVITYSGIPFTDVSSGLWYYNAVCYSYENRYFTGTTATRFSPQGTMTRGMFATVLYRLAGEPNVRGNSIFQDVAPGRYYSDGIAWASRLGIIDGYGDGNFGVDDPVTREQMVTLFWRWNGRPLAPSYVLSDYTDATEIRHWAKDAFAWAIYNDVISGKGNGILDPKGTATRAEVAQIVYNYCKNVRG